MSARRRGVAPTVVVFVALAGVFGCMVAYCAFGWGGVVVAGAGAGLIAAVARSESARMARDRQRADDLYVSYHATYGAAPRRRGRAKGR